MGTAIRACSVSTEAISKAEEDLMTCTKQRRALREKIDAAVNQYRTAEKSLSQLELQSAKIRMEVCFLCLIWITLTMSTRQCCAATYQLFSQVEGLNAQQKDLEHQLPSLDVAANPKKEELKKVQELESVIAIAESEMLELRNSSKSLKEKV